MDNYITTYSGVHFTPLAPKEREIKIEDIAHALSLMARANGHLTDVSGWPVCCMMPVKHIWRILHVRSSSICRSTGRSRRFYKRRFSENISECFQRRSERFGGS